VQHQDLLPSNEIVYDEAQIPSYLRETKRVARLASYFKTGLLWRVKEKPKM